MFAIPGLVGILARVIAVVALAAAVMYAVHSYNEHFRDQGRAEIRKAWDADKAERIKRTTDMTNLWDAKRQEAEKAGEERDHERAQRIADAQERARNLPPSVAGAHFPGIAVRVLNEPALDPTAPARAAGKAQGAAAAAADDPDATVGAVVEWGIAVKGMYQACVDRVADIIAFYQSLRDAQPKESTP